MVQPQARRAFRAAALALHLRAGPHDAVEPGALPGHVSARSLRPPAMCWLRHQPLTFHYAANGLDVVKTFASTRATSSPSRPRSSATARPCARWSQWPAGLGDMEEFLPASLTRRRCQPPHRPTSPGPSTASRTRWLRPRSSTTPHSTSLTSTRPSPISILPRPFCPTHPSAPPSSRCTTPSICPAT